MHPLFRQSRLYLLILYSILTLSVGFQIARILYYRHSLFSFQLGFLILCFVWGVLRIFFWSLWTTLGPASTEILLWIPLNIQFATFSLLVVFYAHLVHKSTWEKYMKKRIAIVCITVNAVLLVMACVWLGYMNSSANNADSAWASNIQSAIAGVVFLILVAILAWYGYQLHSVIKSTTKHQVTLYQVPFMIFPVTFIISLLFASRCIFDFVNAAGGWVVEIGSGADDKDEVVIFLAYFLWEIVPTLMIVLLFWRIPTTHIGGITRRGRNTMFMLPPGAATGAVKPQPSTVSRLFNDPQRYDSDDETTGFLHRGSPVTYTTPNQPSSYTQYNFGKNAPYATTPSTPVDDALTNAARAAASKPPTQNNIILNSSPSPHT